MTKYVATISIEYEFEGDLLEEYQESLDDYPDTVEQRKWFIIDRFVGHDNLQLFDQAAKLTIEEKK